MQEISFPQAREIMISSELGDSRSQRRDRRQAISGNSELPGAEGFDVVPPDLVRFCGSVKYRCASLRHVQRLIQRLEDPANDANRLRAFVFAMTTIPTFPDCFVLPEN
jgi:hypothetical protein